LEKSANQKTITTQRADPSDLLLGERNSKNYGQQVTGDVLFGLASASSPAILVKLKMF
jgi:hypothetical protein